MKKLLKIKTCCAVLGAAGVLWGGLASAQGAGNSQLMGPAPTLMEKFSVSDVASMLSEFSITMQLQPYQNDDTATLTATTEGGAQFIITMFRCDDVAKGLGCKQAMVYTGLPNAGFSYEDLNNFNTNSDVTRAINVPAQQMILFGTQIYAHGGIGRENFQLLTALFLNDMQSFMDSQNDGALQVSLKLAPEEKGKTKNVAASGESSGQSPGPRAGTVGRALTAAVSNTRRVQFLTAEAAKYVE